MEEKTFFVYKDDLDGNVAIGTIPPEFEDILTEIKTEWKHTFSQDQLNASIYHEWYNDLSYSLKNTIDNVRNMKLWKSLCDEKLETCKNGKFIAVPEMDELYYFNMGTKLTSRRMYGAGATVTPHVDSGKLFQTSKIKM